MTGKKIKLSPGGTETYDLVVSLENLQIGPVIFSPKQWKAFPHSNHKWNWISVPFREEEKVRVPADKHGIYSFVIIPNVASHPLNSLLVYIGKADRMSFRSEFDRYFSEIRNMKRIPLCKWLFDCHEHLYFCYTEIDDNTTIDRIERDLNKALLPPGNSQYEGILNKAMRAF